ncbi:MAG: apolipoprotein N-acyltransferase [Devosia sp.]
MNRLAESVMLASGWRRAVMMMIAGALGALSAPPLFVLPALFLALPVLVWALDGAEGRHGLGRLFGPAFRIGFWFGLGYFTIAFHWLGSAFFLEGGWYPALMPIAILALAALIALFWGLGTALAHLLWSDGPWRIVALAGALSLAEWARGTLFSGFPFDLLGYALTANDAMMQLASIVGVYGLTFIAILIAATPALAWPADGRALARRMLPGVLAIAVVAAQLGYGSWRLASTETVMRQEMRLKLVQPMITEHTNWAAAQPAAIIDRLIGLSEAPSGAYDPGLDGITHLIWPESVLPFFMSQYPEALARIARMLPPETTLLTGAPRADAETGAGNPGYNALLAISTDGEIVASYDKAHLVPFGEYLPFADLFARFGIRQFVPGTNGWAPGNGRRLVSPPGTLPFIALICYEAIFSGLFSADAYPGGAQAAGFILNITNDSWFDGSIGPEKHAHHARVRAVESGLPLVRVGNSGVTLVTDGEGRVTAALAPRAASTLIAELPQAQGRPTLFIQLGMWPFAAMVGLALVAGHLSRRRRPRPIV